VANGDGQKLIEITERVLSLGISVEQFTIDLAEYFRGILFLRKGIRKESILGMSPDRFSGRILKSLTDTQVEHALELALSLYRSIRYSLNQRFDLELMLSKLSSLRDYLTPREILQGMQELRESMVAGDRSDSQAGSSHPQNPAASSHKAPRETADRREAAVSQEETEHDDSGAPDVAHSSLAGLDHDQVAAIIQCVRPARLALSTALERAVRWEMADAELLIIFGNEYPANAARGEEEVIRNAAADVLGKPVLVRIKVDVSASPSTAPPEEGTQDENVEMVKRVFRGEIVEEEQ
jgi:DNA polymerase-3 subunit gamma/tau